MFGTVILGVILVYFRLKYGRVPSKFLFFLRKLSEKTIGFQNPSLCFLTHLTKSVFYQVAFILEILRKYPWWCSTFGAFALVSTWASHYIVNSEDFVVTKLANIDANLFLVIELVLLGLMHSTQRVCMCSVYLRLATDELIKYAVWANHKKC